MRIELTTKQADDQTTFRGFAHQEIMPFADQYDRDERLPQELIGKLAKEGYLGALVPKDYSGLGMDMITFGLLNEEIGRACSSVRSLLTVQSMVAYAVLRCGSKKQKECWLPRLATGQVIGAFALSEPTVGSDARSVQTTATPRGESYVLQGLKQWISFGQVADLFLIFAQCEGKLSAFLVERGTTPGLTVEPISGMLGTRASMLAQVSLDDCEVPEASLIGGLGLGLATVGASSLDIGRYSVAWGCVGIVQACLDACIQYTGARQQFGAYLKDHQLIKQMITEMLTNAKAARLLCYQAGYLKDLGDPGTIMDTLIAKYFASKAAVKAAGDAVQIHGANGCSPAYPVQRYWRDSKVMEIIEGTSQIQEITIAKYAYMVEQQ